MRASAGSQLNHERRNHASGAPDHADARPRQLLERHHLENAIAPAKGFDLPAKRDVGHAGHGASETRGADFSKLDTVDTPSKYRMWATDAAGVCGAPYGKRRQ